MDLTETQKSLPEKLAETISGRLWRTISLGLSPSKVFRLEAKNKNSLYLKIAPRGVPGFSLSRERQVLDWLGGRFGAPEVLFFAAGGRTDYLLLSEVPGRPASDAALTTGAADVAEQVTNTLKLIHGLPAEDCPFDEGVDRKIEIVRQRIEQDLVEEKEFDDERQGRTAADLFAELVSRKPRAEDLVFTHGDCCLPNVIFDGPRLSGFIDWGNAGVADRYHDLAILSRSVGYNFGDEWQPRVFEVYGVEPDWEKIHFYRLMDEFF